MTIASQTVAVGFSSPSKPVKALAPFVRLIRDLGGTVPDDAPLVHYRPNDFAAAVRGGYLDVDPSGGGYRLTPRGRDLSEQRRQPTPLDARRRSARALQAAVRGYGVLAARLGVAMHAHPD